MDTNLTLFICHVAVLDLNFSKPLSYIIVGILFISTISCVPEPEYGMVALTTIYMYILHKLKLFLF